MIERITFRKPFVVARDRVKGWIKLGGLGALGVGEMWFREEANHRTYPGYESAEDQDSTGGFGVPERSALHE